MTILRFLWRMARRRRVIRLLLWLSARLIRLFGWRRTARVVFRNRRHLRAAGIGAWRTTVRLLWMGRSAWRLLGWLREHAPRLLGGGRAALRSGVRPRLERPGSADSGRRASVASAHVHWRSRVRRRRDEVRRSLLSAIGMDPAWRPARKGRRQLERRTAERPPGGS